MIIVETTAFKHRYHGDVILERRGDLLLVEAHGETPRIEDELYIWTTDVFDMFFVEDVISIRGEA